MENIRQSIENMNEIYKPLIMPEESSNADDQLLSVDSTFLQGIPKSPKKLPKLKANLNSGNWQQTQIFLDLTDEELQEKAKSSPSELAIGDWKRILSPEAFRITRLKVGTEPAFSSDLVKVNDAGIFCCVNCEGKLFDSSSQYDCGIGWPTFSCPIHWKKGGTVALRTEKAFTNLYCSRCDAHLGNMLDAGPLKNDGKPDGMRYCVSGIAMKFIPENEENRKMAIELRKKAKTAPKELTIDDWKLILTPEQFRVTRLRENEEPFTSGLERMNLDEKGIFRCVCCDGALFDMSNKRNVDSGWPTFTDYISKKRGGKLSYRTVGVTSFLQCSKCDAHIGLLTDNDGEIQYYTNGTAMTFSPKAKQPASVDVMVANNEDTIGSKDTNFGMAPKLTMEQMVGMGRDLI